MAEVIRYVDPDASGTGTGLTWTNAYTSLSAWEAAEQTNLVTDGDWHHCYVRASSGSVDSTITTIDGWTTGANNYILIEAASGDEAQASGWSTSRYRLSLSNSDALVINEDYVRVVGLQIEVTSSNGTGQDCITITAPGGITSDIKIQNCRLEGPGSGYAFVQRGIYAAAGTIDIVNTVIYDTAISASGAAGIWCNGATMTISNCVISKTSYGMYEPSGTITAKNCAVFDCVSDDWLSGPTTIDYCASDDGDGTNPVAPLSSDWANEFTDPANGDFTPEAGGNVEGGGIAISGLTTDMVGETWADPPTIGALEIASSGYTITADSGTLTLTGTAASLLQGFAVDAGAGSYTLTGTAASLEKGYALDAGSGAFTFTGQDAGLLRGLAIDAGSGVYTLTGAVADLLKGYAVDVDAGSFILTGQDASLSHGVANKIDAEAGTFVLTGTSAGLLHDKTISAEVGGFVLTGFDAGLDYGLSLTAEAGAFTLTGQDVDLIYNAILTAEAGGYVLTGSDVTLTYGAAFIPVDRRSITVDITQGRTITVSVSQSKAVAGQVTQRRDMEATIGG